MKYIIPLLALSLIGCATPTMDKMRANHSKKYPIRPLPMPTIVTKTNGITIQEQRPFNVEKQDAARSFGMFVPASVTPSNGVMINPPTVFPADPPHPAALYSFANQGSNTILRLWFVSTVDGARSTNPVLSATCWPEHQIWGVLTPMNMPGQGFVEGENEPCAPGFAPAGRMFVSAPTGRVIEQSKTNKYLEYQVGGPGIQLYDTRFKVFLLKKTQ